AASWRARNGVGVRVGGVHRELNQVNASADDTDQFLAQLGGSPQHAAVGIEPDAGTLGFGVFDHVHHVGMEHGFTPTGAAQKRAIRACFVCDLVPQLDWEQVRLVGVVELPNL